MSALLAAAGAEAAAPEAACTSEAAGAADAAGALDGAEDGAGCTFCWLQAANNNAAAIGKSLLFITVPL